MARLPDKIQDLINYCNEHFPVWNTAPATIGLTPAQVTAFKTATGEAATAVNAQAAAKDTAKASTITANAKVKALRANAGAMLRSITTYAAAQADPSVVYAAAQVAPPSPRTPSAPPGQPTNLTATLDDEGNITLKWKCQNPEGGNVVYSVERREGAEGNFAQVGISGTRVFLDETLPAGGAMFQYLIRGYRGNTIGPASPVFTLQFGSGGQSFTFAKAKMAA